MEEVFKNVNTNFNNILQVYLYKEVTVHSKMFIL